MAPAERSALVREGAVRLARRADEVAALVTTEMGKPIVDATGDVGAAVATARQFAELGPLHRGHALQGDPGATDVIHRVPRGVVACLVPWNDPVAIVVQGISAALVTGNCVVVKASERASWSVAAAVACFDHLPEGVVGLVLGDDHTGELLVHSGVDAVLFTGSVRAGRNIAVCGAASFVHTVLELGGSDPLVVDADVDPVWAAEQAAVGCFANAGQICVGIERIYCHERIAADLVDALATRAAALRQGPGRHPSTRLGPLVDERHREHVHAQVLDALDAGARLVVGGHVPAGPGSFYPATVLADVPPDAALLRQETFGPVAPVVAVPSFEEGLRRAAESEFGLGAAVLTADLGHAQAASRELPVGTVRINSVFGGAPGGSATPHGVSGNAAGYGPSLLDELTRQRVVHLEPCPAPRPGDGG